MSLVLRSGRPGTGKSVYANWLKENRGFVHVETDADLDTLVQLASIESLDGAIAIHNQVRAKGPDVIVEWGFKVAYFQCVRYLRNVGFDSWWFDGDEQAARQGYISRSGDSLQMMKAYQVQVDGIQEAWPKLERFYGDHIIRTVSAGPTYMSPNDIASVMFVNSAK